MRALVDADFDHAYMVVEDIKAFESLARRGFSLSERVVEHPGGAICRFVYFSPLPDARRPIQYLEFVSLGAIDEYKKFEDPQRLKQGLSPRDKDQILAPGFSLCAAALEANLPHVQGALKAYAPHFEHVNYDWKGQAERGPGWNYLKFGTPLLPFLDIWLTEYEPHPSRPQLVAPVHANTCDSIIGCVWQAGSEALEPLANLSAVRKTNETMAFADGFTVWFGDQYLAGLDGVEGDFKAMVLSCRSLATFEQMASPDRIVQWNGQRAALLEPYKDGWRILVVEK